MAKQTQLPMMPPIKRKPQIKRAHVCDAGEGQAGHPFGAQFRCARCGWESEWLCFENIGDTRRGIPCEVCNALIAQATP